MPLEYSKDQHRLYLDFLGDIGQRWLQVFKGNTEFYSAAYWDLLKEIWRHEEPVRKTDALGFMTNVKSAHTAGKYIEAAIAYGFVIERENPDDARSKLLELSPDMRTRLDAFFDQVIKELLDTAEKIAPDS